jgi:hypothetical protein
MLSPSFTQTAYDASFKLIVTRYDEERGNTVSLEPVCCNAGKFYQTILWMENNLV